MQNDYAATNRSDQKRFVKHLLEFKDNYRKVKDPHTKTMLMLC